MWDTLCSRNQTNRHCGYQQGTVNRILCSSGELARCNSSITDVCSDRALRPCDLKDLDDNTVRNVPGEKRKTDNSKFSVSSNSHAANYKTLQLSPRSCFDELRNERRGKAAPVDPWGTTAGTPMGSSCLTGVHKWQKHLSATLPFQHVACDPTVTGL